MLYWQWTKREMALWAAALAVGLAVCTGLCWGRQSLAAGAAVRAGTLRLHIQADADTARAQTAKLAVRDAVLALVDACPAQDAAAARRWAAQNLGRIQLAAAQALAACGQAGPVQVGLVNMYFDTTRYPAGALPAGRYDAVRVTLGAGRPGRNWWCVLYPGLCRAACTGYQAPAAQELVCGEYILRFKLVEWWQGRTAPRGDVVLARA